MKKFLLVSNYVPKPDFKYPGCFTCPLKHRKVSHQKIIEMSRFWKEDISWDILNIEENFSDLNKKNYLEKYDLIFLSGSPYHIDENEIWILELKKFLKSYVKNPISPMIGICFGTQLLVEALGGKLERMKNMLEGDISLVNANKDILGYSFTFHQDKILKLPKESEVIAYGPENIPYVIKFSDKLFGIQSHPENLLKDTSQQAMANSFWKEYFDRILEVKV